MSVAPVDLDGGLSHVLRLLVHIVHQPAEHQAHLVDGAQRHADLVGALQVLRLAVVARGHVEGLTLEQFQRARELALQQGGQASHDHRGEQREGREMRLPEIQRPAAQQQRGPQAKRIEPDALAHAHAPPGRCQAAQQAPVCDDALVQPCAAVAFLAHGTVQLLRGRDLLAFGLGAHGHVALRLAIADDGNGIGAHPVVVAVLAPVLDQGRPGLARLERGPHVREGGAWHVGVAYQVVRLAQDFLCREAADIHEGFVGVAYVALGVRGGHQGRIVGKSVFILCYGMVDSHARRFLVRGVRRA